MHISSLSYSLYHLVQPAVFIKYAIFEFGAAATSYTHNTTPVSQVMHTHSTTSSRVHRPVGRGVHMHPSFFSLMITCHFTEVLNCMSNRLRLHAILSISLTKPHLVQLINITPQSISRCDQYMHNLL